MKSARVAKSGVHGDIPGKLSKEFCPELAFPVSLIFNNILRIGEWPNEWKIETGIPLAKGLGIRKSSRVVMRAGVEAEGRNVSTNDLEGGFSYPTGQ